MSHKSSVQDLSPLRKRFSQCNLLSIRAGRAISYVEDVANRCYAGSKPRSNGLAAGLKRHGRHAPGSAEHRLPFACDSEIEDLSNIYTTGASSVNQGIILKKIRSDEDSIEIEVAASDGSSTFRTTVDVGHEKFAGLVAGLDRFKNAIYGGVHDVRLGVFGPEYAGGAFHARLHFHRPGHGLIFITVHAESEWNDFTLSKVASRATLYLKTEPALFDNFIVELGRLRDGETEEASLSGR